MATQSTFKKCRDGLQQGIYAVINPFVRLMIRIGITPNMVTTIGLLGNLAAAVIFGYAGYQCESGEFSQWWLITLAGAVIIGFSFFDMLDGQVARLGNMVSRFGALYDSVLDRYCELFTVGGIAYFMFAAGYKLSAFIAFLAMVGSVMVSYVRARAEGLDIECKVGFMQRPERVVVTSAAALAAGICGQCEVSFDPMYILTVAMTIIAVFANITAFARIAHCKRELTK